MPVLVYWWLCNNFAMIMDEDNNVLRMKERNPNLLKNVSIQKAYAQANLAYAGLFLKGVVSFRGYQ